MSTIINAGRIAPLPKGLYDASAQYVKLDIVTFSNESYICKQACQGVAPTDTDYWQLLAGAAGGGKSIVNITKTSSHGLIDTYTILYTDRTTSTFTVTNGKDGEDGTDGTDGRGITSIVETTSTQESGGRNVVTVTYTDGTTSTFDVYNGEAGQDAEEDLMITATRIGGTDNYYSMSYTWQELKTRVINGHDNMHALLILDNFGPLKMPYYRSDSDASLYFAADVREGENVTHYELIYGDEGYAILTAKQLDDVVMGKIDGTSFYRVTGYSGLNATPTFSGTAETGNENKIYVDILTNRAYRWTKSIVSLGESKYKLLSEELDVVTDNEINSLLPQSTKKAISAKVLRDNFYTESEVNTLLSGKQATLTFDTTPTANSTNPVTSGGIYNVIGDIETLLASI